MNRRCLTGIFAASTVAACAASTPAVTFNRDVLPILQKNCQTCHRPGEVAPMPLITYKDARPWAKAIKSVAITRKMPPWYADPRYGHFANEHKLTDAQIATLASWADTGAPEGDAQGKPAAIAFVDGWNLKPDLIVEMPTEFQVPATGAVEYQYMKVKANFPEDVWVSEAEMRPGNSQVVHHGEVWVLPPGTKWMADAAPGVAYPQTKMKKQPEDHIDILGKFNPGVGAQTFVFGDSAKFVPKGSDLVFEIHYTTAGKPTTDRTKVGIVFAKGPHRTRYFTSYGPQARNLVIAPEDNNGEVVSEMTLTAEAKLVNVQPHMHVRGKDYELRLIFPTGETQTVFKGKFDFNWQISYNYAEPILMPKGTRLVGISHFDNSRNNPFNPDNGKEVHWGFQNWEEMSNCFMGLVFDSNLDPRKLTFDSGPSLLPAGKPGPTLAALQARP
jgi:mono/diheme cytochrome c family protein